jgi:hypothetical protein
VRTHARARARAHTHTHTHAHSHTHTHTHAHGPVTHLLPLLPLDFLSVFVSVLLRRSLLSVVCLVPGIGLLCVYFVCGSGQVLASAQMGCPCGHAQCIAGGGPPAVAFKGIVFAAASMRFAASFSSFSKSSASESPQADEGSRPSFNICVRAARRVRLQHRPTHRPTASGAPLTSSFTYLSAPNVFPSYRMGISYSSAAPPRSSIFGGAACTVGARSERMAVPGHRFPPPHHSQAPRRASWAADRRGIAVVCASPCLGSPRTHARRCL